MNGRSDQSNKFDDSRQKIFAERYLVLAKISEGGMGTVFKVKDLTLDKEFALKLLAGSDWNEQQIMRFQKEARLAGKLKHANIATIYDFGITANREPYMVQELIDGSDLKSLIAMNGHLETAMALAISIDVAKALEHAHKNGIIHRDIKPGNILLIEDGETMLVKLVDFGIARSDDSEDQRLTSTGAIVGSPSYLSPEQARGGKIDARADIYSLGCVLFEALTGTLPFQADSSLELIGLHISEPAPTLAEKSPHQSFPQSLENVLQKLLAKDPDDRYQTAADVVRVLSEILEQLLDEPNSIETVDPHVAPPVVTDMNSKWVVLVAIILGGIMLGASFLLQVNRPTEHKRTTNKNIKEVESRKHALLVRGIDTKLSKESYIKPAETKNLPHHINTLAVQFDAYPPGSWDFLKDKQLDILDTSGNDLSDADFHTIAQITSLTELNLRTSTFAEENLLQLSSLKNLQKLDLTFTGIKGPGLAVLAKLKKLDQLNLNHCLNMTDEGFANLSKASSLRILEYTSGRISSRAIKSLSQSNLRQIKLDKCTIEAGSFRNAGGFKRVAVLELSGTDITSDDLEAVAEMPILETLYLSNCKAIDDSAVERFKRKKPHCNIITKSSGLQNINI